MRSFEHRRRSTHDECRDLQFLVLNFLLAYFVVLGEVSSNFQSIWDVGRPFAILERRGLVR